MASLQKISRLSPLALRLRGPAWVLCFEAKRNLCTNRDHQSPSPSSTANAPYVSKHFHLTGDEVVHYLNQRSCNFRLSGNVAIVETCPFCHDTRGLPDNLYKLHIFRDTGGFNCFRCKAKGSWYQFRTRLSHGDNSIHPVESVRTTVQRHAHPDTPLVTSTARGLPSEQQQKRLSALWNDDSFSTVRRYLCDKRGLSEQTLRRFGVGACKMQVAADNTYKNWRVDQCMSFPMYDDRGTLMRYKLRSVRTKAGMQLQPRGAAWGLFGLAAVPEDVTEIVFTEGELDAMSVWQATGRHAVSLPNGASSLPVEVLPLLERFRRIYLWMDADDAGQAGARQFARKLGMRRCLIVPPDAGLLNKGVKDANDWLRHSYSLDDAIVRANPVAHDGVVRFDDMRESVFDHIIAAGSPKRCGVQSQSLPHLNDLLKGHRRGELTILSGHTGIGKTTLLSQLSLDYCMQGVVTMWGSFEIPIAKLAAGLLRQMHAALGGSGDLTDEYDTWADRMSELPLLFMKYHGSNSMDTVFEAMEFGNYMYDCTHFVLDNLQFMTYGQKLGRGGHQGGIGGGFARTTDQFEVMNDAVSRLRTMCTRDNVHVTLVVHPRKESDEDRIQLASVFGSAKATQEADNVVLLQRAKDGSAQLEVKKNRFDGQCGRINLWFDRRSKLFHESDKERCRMEMTVGETRMQALPDDGASSTDTLCDRRIGAAVDLQTMTNAAGADERTVVASAADSAADPLVDGPAGGSTAIRKGDVDVAGMTNATPKKSKRRMEGIFQ